MSSLQFQRRRGFTIVELLIVIVVIGILAAITVVAYNGIQLRARDTDRLSDISQIRKKLEAYKAINNVYPSAYDMMNSTFRKDNLDIQSDSTVIPAGSSLSIGYCAPTPQQYCYSGSYLPGDCYAAGDTTCIGYWLRYRTEANPTVIISLYNP